MDALPLCGLIEAAVDMFIQIIVQSENGISRPIIINMDHIISFDYNTEKGRYFINLDAAVGIPTPTDRPKNYYFISKDEYNLLKKKLT